ncbi:endolysin [Streptomyces phage Janus]|uniref:Endolysin n=1 Tax=Streptomyces phage Janus TaxID=2510525 RepID=A0A411CPR5_9CAUD|nr:endolysin [Streptomyces phage Janus]QAY15931.1 endolysin [Streptomyces phage Janus]
MSVNIVSRSAWGAKPWNGTPNSVSLSQRTEFFIHYDGANHINYTGVQVPRTIERTHINQGWAGVGYNFVIDQAGTIYEGRGWGLQGAHCPGHNVSGIGVQIAIGGDQEPSDKALAAARALYDEACRKTGRTLAKKGHRDGIATACPGGKLYAWVKAGMPAGDYEEPSSPAPAPEKPASWDGKSFPGASAFKLGQSHPAVTVLGQRLVAHGYGRFYKEGPGPRFTEADKDAVQAFQKAQGWTGSDADGYPGAETWKRLQAAPAKAPSKPAPKPSTIVALNSAVKPGARHTQVKELQQLLIKAGYGPIPGAPSTYYGPETQKAVARFHNKNVHLRSAGKSYDPAIGKQGFVELQKEAGRK